MLCTTVTLTHNNWKDLVIFLHVFICVYFILVKSGHSQGSEFSLSVKLPVNLVRTFKRLAYIKIPLFKCIVERSFYGMPDRPHYIFDEEQFL